MNDEVDEKIIAIPKGDHKVTSVREIVGRDRAIAMIEQAMKAYDTLFQR